MTTLSTRNRTILPSLLNDFFESERWLAPDLFNLNVLETLPSVNIVENGKEFKIELAAPGMDKKDFKVNVEDNVLTISAEKEEEKREDGERYARREFSYNAFTRSFRMPEEVNPDKVECLYENGILKIALPKRNERMKSKAKAISVK